MVEHCRKKTRISKMEGVIEYVKDISDIKLTEAALRESSEKYHAIFNAANDAVFIHNDTDGAILEVNQKACELTGYTSEELKKLRIEDFSVKTLGYTQDLAISLIKKAIVEKPQLIEWKVKNKRGEEIWVEVNLIHTNICGEGRLLAVVRDTTERKETEEKLKQYSENLESMVAERSLELDRMKMDLFTSSKLAAMGRMGAGIAHQMKTPITSAKLCLDSLKTLCRDPKQLEFISLLKTTCEELHNTVECMLTLAGFGVGKSRPKVEVDINHMIDGVLKLTSLEMEERGIVVAKNLCPETLKIMAVPGELEQILINLINNACDAMKEGGTVVVTSMRSASNVEIRVRDTGIGISKENLDKIFEPFFTTKLATKGIGLGLSIADGIIKRYNGKILVQSELGKGTEFCVSLPMEGN